MKNFCQIVFLLCACNLVSQNNVGSSASDNNLASTNSTDNPTEISGSFQTRMMSRAIKLYEYKEFAEAIPYYEKALVGNESNKILLTNLAECYRLTNNVTGQLMCYENLFKSKQADPIHDLYYGQALMENGEYDKAKQHFKNYKADERGVLLASAIDKRATYKKNAACFEVNIAPFNSEHDDYCAVKFYDAIVFASTRNKTSWIKREQGWSNENYLQLYKTDGTAESVKPFIGDLQSRFNDGPISFTKDFSTIFFARNNTKKNEASADGTFKLKFMEASMDMNGFAKEHVLPFIKPDFNYTHPAISPDGLTLFFSSDMPGGKGGMDIYECVKDSFGVWSEPRNLGPSVNTAGNEVFPFIASNGLLYFSSNGRDGIGGLDIYENKMHDGKATKSYNMGEPVNSKDDDFGVFLNEDCKTGYISSNRKAGGMDDDIYEFKILKPIKRGKDFNLKIKDKSLNKVLDSVKVVMNGDTLIANENGEVFASLEEHLKYNLEIIRPNYIKTKDTVSAGSAKGESVTKNIFIEKDPKLFLKAVIRDAKTNNTLDGVTIKLIDIVSNSEVDHYTTNSKGDYTKPLFGKKVGDKLTYLVRFEKPGYLKRTVIFNYLIKKPGEINMNDKLHLTLGRVEIGMDLGKMIDLKPIYFDVAKSNIRKDAAVELDKIVAVMKEYPNMYIELGSHTDCRSSAESNIKLSTARAKASAAYIVKKGINKLRIVAKGYGESKLLNNCGCEGKVKSTCPESEHDRNRRTEFLITRLK